MRDAVQEILHGDRRAWSIEELVAEVGRQGHRTTRSSVLRALLALERDAVVERVAVGDRLQRYEAAGEHHEHIRCERCGSVREVAGCLLEATAWRVERLTGFEVTDHRLLLSGLCPGCQRTSRDELLELLKELS